MTLVDEYFSHVPEYYDEMYLEGYTPAEIMYAFNKKMDREMAEREEAESLFDAVKVESVVKIKK